MAKKKKITFCNIFNEFYHKYEEDYKLDYFSGYDEIEPKPYDDYYAITTFGGSEGIYTSFYVQREADGSEERIAVAKTLSESDEAYLKMHELAAKVCLELRKKSVE